jgi:uncharacterized protein YcnI
VSTTPARPLVRLATGAVLAGALALGTAAAASAHVRVVPETTAAGAYALLTFRVPNESTTASTTAVSVDLPTDHPLTYVGVEPVPGWTATVEEGDLPEPVEVDGATITRAPVRVVWTADDGVGIGDGTFQRFVVSAGPLPEAGTDLVLPAHQTYSDGTVVDWDEVAQGDAEPESPAPAFTTTAAVPDAAHGTDDAAGTTTTEPSDDDALPVLLGGAGLAAGLVALVLAALAWRRAGAARR